MQKNQTMTGPQTKNHQIIKTYTGQLNISPKKKQTPKANGITTIKIWYSPLNKKKTKNCQANSWKDSLKTQLKTLNDQTQIKKTGSH